MTVLKSTFVAFFFCLASTMYCLGQEEKPLSTDRSCRKFVQEFYSWYAAKAAKERQEMAGDLPLKYRSDLFSSAIVQGIREVDEAQKVAGSDLISFDVDPFVGADGIAKKYIVERASVTNNRCMAEVHAVWDGKEDQAPDVISETVIENGKWTFVNFYFPSPSNPKGWDLLGALKAFREGEKKKPEKVNKQ